MAKFHNYYVLCPLIDQKSFLGVAKDKLDEHVIVTLSRNVVNKYQLSDQKQVSGWTSKDHITSAIIYDQERESYVGVFNNNTIKTWKEDSDNLDKQKKYKFPIDILKIIPRENQTSLLVFSNGICASLPYAIDNRKTYQNKALLKETDTVVETACYTVKNTDYICYIVKNHKNTFEIINCPLRDELGDMDQSKLTRTRIARPDNVHVVGKFICTEAKETVVYVLWNDAKMMVYDFKDWKTVGTVPWVSTICSVSITWMGKDHLILYGGSMEQDGAVIVAFNVALGVGSCRYPMKMYSEYAQLYCYFGRVILEASNHIGMMPYILEPKRNLSSLLGSHEIDQDEVMEIANWDSNTPHIPPNPYIKDLIKLGVTERFMCNTLLPPLIEKNDFKTIHDLIKQFTDVPEPVLVAILQYSIKLVNPNKVDISDEKAFSEICARVPYAVSKKGLKAERRIKLELLSNVLQLAFSDALIIPHLRSGLSLDDTLFLMSYITYTLVHSVVPLNVDFESKLLDWCVVLMDAFYQQYLMTKSEKVTLVLQNTLNVVTDFIRQLNNVSDILPLLHNLVKGKLIDNEDDSLPYTIELMHI